MFSRDYSLNLIRQSAKRWLVEFATYQVEREIIDDIGGKTKAVEIVAANVPCRVIAKSGMGGAESSMAGMQEQIDREYRVALPLYADAPFELQVNGMLVIGGYTYNIIGIQDSLTDTVLRTVSVMRRK